MKACRNGQTDAFGLLVRRYQDRLYPTIARLTGCPEDAQDVLQDAFVRAFQKLDQFHGDSSFYTWVYRIAVNLALSDQRSRKHRKSFALRLAEDGDAGIRQAGDSPATDPVVAAERAEREALVQAALNKLGPEHRAIVILKDFDGHRYEEISELLKIPIGTVRSRLHRARCELRELLGPILHPDEVPRPAPGDAEQLMDA